MTEFEFDVNRIKKRMLRKYPVFGSIINTVNYKISDQIQTAGTDGKNIYFNPDFMKTLDEDKQVFVFSHEVCHIALNHILRSKDKDKKLWNIATDAIINQHLVHDGLPIIEGGVNMQDALNYDAEELYKKLLEDKKKNEEKQGSSNSGDGIADDDFNSHSMWDKTVEDNENEQEEKEKKNISEKEIFEKNEKEIIKKAEDIMDRLNNARKGNSKLTNFGNVGKAKPVTNWKKLLLKALDYEDEQWGHKFSTKNSGYVARIEDIDRDEQTETEVILDVSGSVSEELLKLFLKQVKLILKNSKIKIGTFADEFYGFKEIRKESDIDNLVLSCGGGTNFDCASKAFSKRTDVNKICFTDGDIRCSTEIVNKRRDIVWISFLNENFKPDYGKVIYVPKSYFENESANKDKTKQNFENELTF